VRRKKAEAADAVAEGTVYKDFDLYAGILDDLPDFFEREFTSQNHTGESEFAESDGTGDIMDGHLRAGV
jgi:hypothetical protein